MNKNIRYGIDCETGLVLSRVRSQIALPVLQYDKMLPDNKFQTQYALEKMDVIEVVGSYGQIQWTKMIPLGLKNLHRKYWGMKPI